MNKHLTTETFYGAIVVSAMVAGVAHTLLKFSKKESVGIGIIADFALLWMLASEDVKEEEKLNLNKEA